MEFKDLSAELQEKARTCKSADELLALAQSEGIGLSDEQLQAVAGGSWDGGCVDNTCREVVDLCNTFCPTAWHA